MRILLKNIGQLYQVASNRELVKKGKEMGDAVRLSNAYVLTEKDRILAVGEMKDLPSTTNFDKAIDCTDRVVFPGYVDSHTHLVFAKTRESEFVDRIRGLSYAEIAARGGGILNSAAKLRATSEEELLKGARKRAWEILGYGTTTVEIKSGYGLTVEDELKMLRVAKRLEDYCPLRIKRTLLGAHALPPEYKDNRSAYLDLVCEEMIPRASEEGLAEYVDVFCEQGFFTIEETERVILAGAKYGLKAKIHANQLHRSGGVQIGVKHGAISVDHLEAMGAEEIEALRGSETMPTLLPSAAFFLRAPYQPARDLIDAGLPVALATDYNPGSTPTGNMNFEVALACVQMRMLPEEALIAATLNGAKALELSEECGSIEPGKSADLVITQPLDSYDLIPYFFASNLIDRVMVRGAIYEA